MTRTLRPVLDVADLPNVAFGPRAPLWWGTLGFVVIEGWTLAICVAIMFYLRRNFEAWPPFGTPYPDVILPTISAVVYVISYVPLAWLSRAAKQLDLAKVRVGLVIASAFIIAFCVFRVYELFALNVKWDTNAYGSALWLILLMHATLLVVEAGEVIGMTVMFFVAPISLKHFSDVEDVSFYWYFLAGSWLVLYVLVFWGPRFM